MHRLIMVSFNPNMSDVSDTMEIEDFLWVISEQMGEAFGLDVLSITDCYFKYEDDSFREWLMCGVVQAPFGAADSVLDLIIDFCMDAIDTKAEYDSISLMTFGLPLHDEAKISKLVDLYGDQVRFTIDTANSIHEKETHAN